MYHSIILEDLLDLLSFRPVAEPRCPNRSAAGAPWRAAAERMLQWLSAVCHPDGESPC